MACAEAEKIRADAVLCIGLAGGRAAVTPERIAVNIRDTGMSDNLGNMPRGERVTNDGPAAYFSTVSVETVAEAIREAQIPALVSNTAGTFVCNDVFYMLLHHFAGTATKVGFIHVPQLPEQGAPSLPLEQIVAALQAAIGAL